MITLYEEFLNKLKNNTPFAFSRWGDGEWFNIELKDGKNCDGNIYYKDLGKELKEIINVKQPYYVGRQDVKGLYSASHMFNQDWVNAEVFHNESRNGNLNLLIDILQDLHVVYIGNKDLKKLSFIKEFIEIPQNNVWLIKEQIIDKIKNTIDNNLHKVFLFSAGMATNVFIHTLYQYNKNNTYIDVGSVFDPYVGKITRKYHKNLKITPCS